MTAYLALVNSDSPSDNPIAEAANTSVAHLSSEVVDKGLPFVRSDLATSTVEFDFQNLTLFRVTLVNDLGADHAELGRDSNPVGPVEHITGLILDDGANDTVHSN